MITKALEAQLGLVPMDRAAREFIQFRTRRLLWRLFMLGLIVGGLMAKSFADYYLRHWLHPRTDDWQMWLLVNGLGMIVVAGIMVKPLRQWLRHSRDLRRNSLSVCEGAFTKGFENGNRKRPCLALGELRLAVPITVHSKLPREGNIRAEYFQTTRICFRLNGAEIWRQTQNAGRRRRSQ